MIISNIWKNKNVPNHQPNVINSDQIYGTAPSLLWLSWISIWDLTGEMLGDHPTHEDVDQQKWRINEPRVVLFLNKRWMNQSLPFQRKNKNQFGHPNRWLLSTNNRFEHPHIDLSSQERGLRPLKTVVLSSKHGDLTVAINQHVPVSAGFLLYHLSYVRKPGIPKFHVFLTLW